MIKIEIPINAEVHSMEGPYGRSVSVIVDPIKEDITHLVVRENKFPQTQKLIPIQFVQVTSPEQINLSCLPEQLDKMEAFVEREFIQANPRLGTFMLWPYAEPEAGFILLEHEKIPAGEISVRRGTEVRASDGRIGHVDEFLIDPKEGRITHLILREGHLWGKKDVSIPIAQIEKMDREKILLKLSKQEVEALPEIRARRLYS